MVSSAARPPRLRCHSHLGNPVPVLHDATYRPSQETCCRLTNAVACGMPLVDEEVVDPSLGRPRHVFIFEDWTFQRPWEEDAWHCQPCCLWLAIVPMLTPDCGLWVGHCGVGARAIPCVPSCVVVLCDVGATKTYSGTLLAHWCAAAKTDVEKGVNRMSDLSRKLGFFFGHAVVERCFVRTLAQRTVFLSVVSSFALRLCSEHTPPAQRTGRDIVTALLSVAPAPTCLFHHNI